MNEPLQGMEPGDVVSYVSSTGATCPAILLTEPFRVMDGKTVEGTLGARLQVFNATFNERSLPGSETIVDYSETPQAGCFFLTDKQRWNLDQWNGRMAQGGLSNLTANMQRVAANTLPSAGSIGMTAMGGPIPGNALPDGIMPENALMPPPDGAPLDATRTPVLAGHPTEDDAGESPP